MKSHMATIVCTVILVVLVAGGTKEAAATDTIVTCRGDTLLLTATLLQYGTYGAPVAGQRIFFFDQTTDELLGVVLTGSDGTAILPWTVSPGHPLGETLLNATFYGNESLALAPSCQYALVTVLARTSIHLSVDQTHLAPGDTLILTALLLDDASVPVVSQLLSLYSKEMCIASAVTNQTGYAVFMISCEGSWYSLGENELYVKYARNLSIYSESSTARFTVYIQKIPTSLSLQSSVNPVFLLNSNVSISVRLVGISPALLTVYLDDTALTDVSTSEQGFADIELHVDTRFTLGPHIISICYMGNERFDSSVLCIEINVTSPVLMNLTTPSPLIIGNICPVNIRLTDILGRPISGTRVMLLDMTSDLESMSVTNINGCASFELPIMGKKGMRSIMIYVADPIAYLLNASHIFDLPVWTQPSITVSTSSILGFASPSQHFNFTFLITDQDGVYANQHLLVTLWNGTVTSVVTDSNGCAVLWLHAPSIESNYSLALLFPGLPDQYVLSCSLTLFFIVSRIIPVRIELRFYQVVSALNILELWLLSRGFNGTLMSGIAFEYSWLNQRGMASSGPGGLVYLSLPLPSFAGEHIFEYMVLPSDSVLASSGYIIISVPIDDVLAAQGVGLGGFTVSFLGSVVAIIVYFSRRRHFIN